MPKKTTGRGAAYTSAKKRYLVTNVGIAKPISEGGWERVHIMNLSAPSGDLTIPVEVQEDQVMKRKMAATLVVMMKRRKKTRINYRVIGATYGPDAANSVQEGSDQD
eukprot:804559-Ditylum_brightwellii.AAC.2